MVEIAAAETAAKAGWGLIKPLLGPLACVAAGLVLAETYEHRVPWGLAPQRDRAVVQLADLKAAEAGAGQRAQRVDAAQVAASTTAQVHEAQAQAKIAVQTRTVIEKVPVYVTPAVDHAFGLPVGLLRVTDAAALGLDVSQAPDPAGRPDDAVSGVAPSDFARTVAANYGDCRADAEQLDALNAWLRQVSAVAATTP